MIETKHRLEDETILRSRTERSAFIRGYFDAEGGIPRNTADRFYIQLVQKDLADLTRVRTILEGIDIHCGRIHNPSINVDPDYWRFYVLAESHEDFIRSVSSWHPRKLMFSIEGSKPG